MTVSTDHITYNIDYVTIVFMLDNQIQDTSNWD